MGTKYEVTNDGIVKPVSLSSDPANETGGLYYNTTANKMRYNNGTAWVDG